MKNFKRCLCLVLILVLSVFSVVADSNQLYEDLGTLYYNDEVSQNGDVLWMEYSNLFKINVNSEEELLDIARGFEELSIKDGFDEWTYLDLEDDTSTEFSTEFKEHIRDILQISFDEIDRRYRGGTEYYLIFIGYDEVGSGELYSGSITAIVDITDDGLSYSPYITFRTLYEE